MYIKATDLRTGNKIELNGDLWVVMETMHRTPGKGRAMMQVRIRSLTTGRSMNERFRSTEQVPLAQLETKTMQYLYREDDLLTFMDNETYDQVPINAEQIGDAATYLTEGLEVVMQFHDGKPLGIELPVKIVLKVIETEPGVKGDTVGSVQKPAKTETGRIVQVPLFVNAGDSIRVRTDTGEYVERAGD